MTQQKPKRSRGKPPLSDAEKTVLITLKAPESLRDKLNKIGGSDWMRDAIEAEYVRKFGENGEGDGL